MERTESEPEVGEAPACIGVERNDGNLKVRVGAGRHLACCASSLFEETRDRVSHFRSFPPAPTMVTYKVVPYLSGVCASVLKCHIQIVPDLFIQDTRRETEPAEPVRAIRCAPVSLAWLMGSVVRLPPSSACTRNLGPSSLKMLRPCRILAQMAHK